MKLCWGWKQAPQAGAETGTILMVMAAGVLFQPCLGELIRFIHTASHHSVRLTNPCIQFRVERVHFIFQRSRSRILQRLSAEVILLMLFMGIPCKQGKRHSCLQGAVCPPEQPHFIAVLQRAPGPRGQKQSTSSAPSALLPLASGRIHMKVSSPEQAETFSLWKSNGEHTN